MTLTQQVETATVVGTITLAGNAKVTVTSGRMSNSPKAVSVAVLLGDNASAVALAARYALALDSDVSKTFLVSGTGADIVLTERVANPNDTTLNIAIDNDTCTGLTAAPTSTNSIAGEGITHGYCTIDEYHAFMTQRKGTLGVDASDDATIAILIEAASRYFDAQTGRTFYARAAETRYFDVPEDDLLFFDDDLTTLTTLTNGNGDVITSTDYILCPRNATPYYGVKLRDISTLYWTPNSSGSEQGVISVLGSWGYAQTPPIEVKTAVMEIVQSVNAMRQGQTSAGQMTVTVAGVTIRPEEVPPFAQKIIDAYRRKI